MNIIFFPRDVVDLRMNLRDRASRSQRRSPVSSNSSNSGGSGGGGSSSGHCRSPFSLASSCSVPSTGGLKSPLKASRGQRQSKRSNSAFEVNVTLQNFCYSTLVLDILKIKVCNFGYTTIVSFPKTKYLFFFIPDEAYEFNHRYITLSALWIFSSGTEWESVVTSTVQQCGECLSLSLPHIISSCISIC